MPYILKKYYAPRKLVFFAGEGLLIFLVVNLVHIFFKGMDTYREAVYLYMARTLIVTLVFQVSLYFFDLYDLDRLVSPTDVAVRILQSFGVGCIFLAFLYYTYPLLMISTRIFWPGLLVVYFSVLFWRFLYDKVLTGKMFAENVLILGTGKIAADIAGEIEQRRDTGFRIVQFVGPPPTGSVLPSSIPITNETERLPELCLQHGVDRIVVAMDDRRGNTPVQQLLDCKFMGFPVEYGIKFFERLSGKILVENVNPDWIIFSSGFSKGRLRMFTKQFIDIVLAVFGLAITLPVTLASAIIVRLESPGPALYRQERVGLHGRTFNLIKFRSMRSDAEKDGPVWAMENDDRVTRFGRFIRKTRIDELPQMINVLKGDMSFVGPRPERPVFVEQLAKKIPYYSIRHNVKPGITGWAQICYPYGASEEDALRKLEYDMYYIKYMSLQMDLSIILQTVKTVLFQKGSR